MKKISLRVLAALSLLAMLFPSCTGIKENNQLSDEEKKDGWVLLFDGKSTDGWHLYNKGKTPNAWRVNEDALYCDPKSKSEHGDLASDSAFENFDLKFEWKIEKGGNSGVFINVLEKPDLPAAWASGPEYQLLEKSHIDYPQTTNRSGCLYRFGPQKNAVEPTPFGEWNQSEIRQENGKIEFYLNGVMTAQEDFGSQAWLDKIGQSSFFKQLPEFGRHTRGQIALQDWKNGISFRNIKIRKL